MKNSAHQRKEKLNLVRGVHAIEEALSSGKSIEKIFALKGNSKSGISAILKIAHDRSIPVQFVPVEKLNRLGDAHQGIAAIVSPVSFYSTDDVIAQAYERGELPLLIICDRITDVRNFGAIARTAYASGVHALIIPQSDTAALNSEAIKSSAGALHRIPVCREKNLIQVVRNLKLNGIQVLAADAGASKFIHEVDLKIPTALIMGSEGEGVTKELLRIADLIVKLPMSVSFDSYNVSVAAGMMLYEVMRQRVH